MTDRELLELARKHGASVYRHRSDERSSVGFMDVNLAAFAAAIRAQERERCAALFDDDGELHSGLEVVQRIRSME